MFLHENAVRKSVLPNLMQLKPPRIFCWVKIGKHLKIYVKLISEEMKHESILLPDSQTHYKVV